MKQFAPHSPGAGCVKAVRGRLETLMFEPRLPIQARDESAQVLGWLGDLRPGVGLSEEGLPKFDWQEIPPGEFWMGNDPPEAKFPDEQPRFRCQLLRERGFWISRYPVTVEQFGVFVAQGGYGKAQEKRPDWWTEAGWGERVARHWDGPDQVPPVFRTPNHPQVGVSWYEAVAFCRWLNLKFSPGQLGLPHSQGSIHLPTEAQWERAARGTNARTYPWEGGREADLDTHCNWQGTGLGHTSAVGLFPKGCTPEKVADLAGNVWEWCATKWRGNYENYESEVDDDPESDEARVLRGGSWFNVSPEYLSVSFRVSGHPDFRRQRDGFRCVVVCGCSAPR